MSTPDPSAFDPLALLTRLIEQEVDFVVIGGFAATLHGGELPTRDLDIVYNRSLENLTRLAAILQSVEARLRGAEDVLLPIDAILLRNGEMWTFRTLLGDFDCLAQPVGAPPYEQLKAHAVETPLGAIHVRVASLDDLISMKRTTGRAKDTTKLAELMALRSLEEQEAVQPRDPS